MAGQTVQEQQQQAVVFWFLNELLLLPYVKSTSVGCLSCFVKCRGKIPL